MEASGIVGVVALAEEFIKGNPPPPHRLLAINQENIKETEANFWLKDKQVYPQFHDSS